MGKAKAIVLASWPANSPVLHRFCGAFLLNSFIVIWLSSAISPFLLLAAVWQGWNPVAIAILVITIMAYVPWQKGPISRFVVYAYNTYYPTYFKSAAIVIEDDDEGLVAKQQAFFAVHPHGAFCLGWSMLFCSPFMDHVRFCFAPSLYASPFFRLFSRTTGLPGSAAKAEMIKYLKQGQSLALPPGGFEEATLASAAIDRVFIQKRTGFVKLCLMHGVPIRPIYVFGENKLYNNIQGLWKLRLTLNRYGIPAILVWGHPVAPLLPKRNIDIRVIIGKPLVVPKIESPSKQEVETWHKKYVAALTKLYEDHKEDAMGADAAKVSKLEVW